MGVFLDEQGLWAGSEAGLTQVFEFEKRVIEGHIQKAFSESEAPSEGPRLLSRIEVEEGAAIGVIEVKGGLVNSESPYLKMFGMTGYPELRDALVSASEDPAIKHIVLDVDSGGGAVSGVDDVSKLIRKINDTVKPVSAFSDGGMMSAAYWLGASAGDITLSKGAGAGSIGVLTVHNDYTKHLENEGVKATVVRAGEYKALTTPYEPLSEAGRAQIQTGLDAAYGVFKGHVAEMRAKSEEFVETVMAKGRLFYGQSAVDAGIADTIGTFDDLIGRISANLSTKNNRLGAKPIDTASKVIDNRANSFSKKKAELNGGSEMGKKVLTEQQVAAISAGLPIEEPLLEETAEPAQASVENGPGTDPVPADKPVVASVEAPESDAAVKLLTGQLKEAQSDLVAAKFALMRAEEQVAQLEAVVTPLKDIAAKAVNNMRVALGGSAIDMSGSTASTILAEHASISASFSTKFKVGGVSTVSSAPAVAKGTPFKMDSTLAARINAVRGK